MDGSTLAITLSALFVFVSIWNLTHDDRDNETYIDISRQSQRCEVIGEEMGCMEDSSWSISDEECSCILHGVRIEFPREDN